MKRLRQIFRRYGWRAPVVVCWIAEDRWLKLREWAVLLSLKLKTKGAKGSGIRIGRRLRVSPGGNLSLGNNVHIGDGATFEIGINPEGSVSLGNDTWISRDFHLHSTAQISIGQDVLVGEFVSIRDTTHSFEDAAALVKETN